MALWRAIKDTVPGPVVVLVGATVLSSYVGRPLPWDFFIGNITVWIAMIVGHVLGQGSKP